MGSTVLGYNRAKRGVGAAGGPPGNREETGGQRIRLMFPNGCALTAEVRGPGSRC